MTRKSRPRSSCPRRADQAYYWTEEWQAGETETLTEIAAGNYRTFDSGVDAVAWLHTLTNGNNAWTEGGTP